MARNVRPNPALEQTGPKDDTSEAIPLGDGDIFDPSIKNTTQPKAKQAPAYRVYADSKVAVSKAMGSTYRSKYEAARKTYDLIYEAWDDAFMYFNAHQRTTLQTERGNFKRGDGTENVIYSNVNVMLNATYSKNPDITCNTQDSDDEPFCKAAKALVKALFDRLDKMNLKPKAKRAVGFALLTNCGILKLDFQQKDDSRELVFAELEKISAKLADAKDGKEVGELYGQLEALESQMEVAKPSGFSLGNVVTHNLTIDPYAEMPDGSDAKWMAEDVYLSTGYLKARFTMKDEEGADVLVYKPTHKVSLSDNADQRDDGLGVVYEAIDAAAGIPTKWTEEERLSYLNTYYTQCVYLWDITTRRLFLFLKDDWKWPVWVWDDPLGTTRFFPYYIISFGMNTGRGTSVGEVAYYLDQQDEVNDINRQRARVRRTVFDYFFYNSNKITKEDAESFINALRGVTASDKHALGVKLEEGQSVKDVFEALLPPSAEFEKIFDKTPAFEAMNRISNSNDALRGGQFKTNTNVPAVEAYQQAAQLSIGSKIDPIEDCFAALALGVIEIATQNMTQEDVAGLIGSKLAQGWQEMDLATFNATYSITVVGGSTEKPNSAFKKKEAIQIAQALGQFAKAAPGAVMQIMLKLFEKAFTDVVINDDDWELLGREIQASLSKGVSQTQPGAAGADASAGGAEGAPGQAEIDQLLAQVPPEIKQKAAAAAQQGASPQQIMAMLKGGGSAPAQ